jgi:hypothetical protein
MEKREDDSLTDSLASLLSWFILFFDLENPSFFIDTFT